MSTFIVLNTSIKKSLHLEKKIGKFHNRSDPLPPILAKVKENFEKFSLFYALKVV